MINTCIDSLSVKYGQVVSVDEVSLCVNSSSIVGVIGPNGAGKTSLIDAVTGFCPVANGRVLLNDTDITRLAATSRARMGLGRTFQNLELFEDLTVRENLPARQIDVTHWRTGSTSFDQVSKAPTGSGPCCGRHGADGAAGRPSARSANRHAAAGRHREGYSRAPEILASMNRQPDWTAMSVNDSLNPFERYNEHLHWVS